MYTAGGYGGRLRQGYNRLVRVFFRERGGVQSQSTVAKTGRGVQQSKIGEEIGNLWFDARGGRCSRLEDEWLVCRREMLNVECSCWMVLVDGYVVSVSEVSVML